MWSPKFRDAPLNCWVLHWRCYPDTTAVHTGLVAFSSGNFSPPHPYLYGEVNDMRGDGIVESGRAVTSEADIAEHMNHCAGMGDERLVRALGDLVRGEREELVELLLHLAEFDKRRLYEPLGSTSLFAYCTRVLGYSEGGAAKRIQSARAAAKFPSMFGMLKRGELHMAAVVMLAPHLDSENHRRILRQAHGKSRRELELMAAGLAPRADTADLIRRLAPVKTSAASTNEISAGAAEVPASSPSVLELERSSSTPCDDAPARMLRASERIEPLSAQRVKFSFTAGIELLEMVERARALVRHKHPSGRLEDVFTEALGRWLESNDPERRLERGIRRVNALSAKGRGDGAVAAVPSAVCLVAKPRRSISQRVKDEVWKRDGGRCSYTAQDGTRCDARDWLEYDHILPWALGGPSNNPGNIRLLCRAHNQMMARRVFGEAVLNHARAKAEGEGAR